MFNASLDSRRPIPLLLAAAWMTLASGCAAPPSVMPLMTQVSRVLEQEQKLQVQDAQRDQSLLTQRKNALADAFDADLAQRQTLDHKWVRQAAHAYVNAVEHLAIHQRELQNERQRRRMNLQAAHQALARAAVILHLQRNAVSSLWPEHLTWLSQASGSSASLAPGRTTDADDSSAPSNWRSTPLVTPRTFELPFASEGDRP